MTTPRTPAGRALPWWKRYPSYRRRRIERLNEQIAVMEQRVLNAATVEGARNHHDKLDLLVSELEAML